MSRYWKVTKYIVLLAITATMIIISAMMASSRALKKEYHWSRQGSSTQVIITPNGVRSLLSGVKDTELDANINELGLVHDVVVPHAGAVDITMTLTTPACPYGKQIIADVKRVLLADPAIADVKLHLVFDPPWTWDAVPKDVRNRIFQRFSTAETVTQDGRR